PSEGLQGGHHHVTRETPKGNHPAPAVPRSVSRPLRRLAEVVPRSWYPRSVCSVLGRQPMHGEAQGPPCVANPSTTVDGSPPEPLDSLPAPVSRGLSGRACPFL